MFPCTGGIGGWEISLCKTIIIAPGKIMCECEGIGAIAIIEVYKMTLCKLFVL